MEIINSVSTYAARSFIQDETGKQFTRQSFSTIFKLMVGAGHAAEPQRRGDAGHILISKLNLWVNYIKGREARIISGEWKSNRAHSISDFYELTGEPNEDKPA